MRRFVLLFFVLSAAMSLTALGQVPENSGAAAAYGKARSLFFAGNYAAARDELEKCAGENLPASLRSEAEYMMLCADFKCGDGVLDERRLQRFMAENPDSPHRDRLKYMSAAVAFAEGRWDDAARDISECSVFNLSGYECQDALRIAGLSDLNAGNLEAAEVSFTVLKGIEGEMEADADYNLAYINYLEKDYAGALRGFGALRDDDRHARSASCYVADIYCRTGKYAEAEKEAAYFFDRFGKNDLSGVEMYRIYGTAKYYTGDYEAAVRALAVYFGNRINPVREAYYVMGMSSCMTRRYDMAVKYLKEVTTQDDAMSQDAYLNLGISYLKLNDKPHARMSFRQASMSDYDKDVTLRALYNYALCVYETSYSPFNESVEMFERLLNEYPGSAYAESASDYLSDAYLATSDYEAALASLSKIKNPDMNILRTKQMLLFRLGVQSFAAGQYNDAVTWLGESLGLSYDKGTYAEALYWRGEALYRLARWKEAERDFRLCLSSGIQDKYYMARYNLGYISFKHKEYGAAATDFRESVKGLSGNKVILADAYNRLGDCYYHNRSFSEAESYYGLAAKTDPAHGDYPAYQKAFIAGLRKDYAGKVAGMDLMIKSYPDSHLADDAMFEKGRAYVMSGQSGKAIDVYMQLADKYPNSGLARRALSEMALLYAQQNDFTKASGMYRAIMEKYPGSEEARQAQRDFRVLCIDMNRVDDYAAVISGIKGGVSADSERNELDSLTFLAAEQLYFDESRGQDGLKALENYVSKYPDGIFMAEAYYYLGVDAYEKEQFDAALDCLGKVVKRPDSKYAPQAMNVMAGLYEMQEDCESLKGICNLLLQHAQNDMQREVAMAGLMRSSYRLKAYSDAIDAATSLVGNVKTEPELVMEARYVMAASEEALGKYELALDNYRRLAEDTRSAYGAEAGYKVAEILFGQGKNKEAEDVLMKYIEKSTPHAYWLARGFVLLADVYVAEGRPADARQYLVSLKQNYDESEEINAMIEERLAKLDK